MMFNVAEPIEELLVSFDTWFVVYVVVVQSPSFTTRPFHAVIAKE